ncbi:MAG: PH domain-containing protein [Propionibacteriales bacterium]|nr:PH domain-containing protein [Propionibacteriales bacterium]
MSATDVAPAVTATALRRLHPLTPFFRSWQLVGAVAAGGLSVFRDDLEKLRWIWRALHGDVEVSLLMQALGVLLVVALVVVIASWLSWRATGFAIIDDASPAGTLLYHRGLIVRQRSQVRLNRVQSVDVNQPFFPRLCGLAAVRLDMAAGDGASVNLAYLRRPDAWALREEILRHTAVAPTGPDSAGTTGGGASEGYPRASDPSGELIAEISTARLVKANLLDGVIAEVLLVVWLVALVVGGVVFGWKGLAAGVAGIIPVTVAIAVQLRRQVASMMRDANFRLMRTASGIRTSSGLTSTTNRTIDLDRIQGVRLEEPYLWRRLGWTRVGVDVAGASENSHQGASLMPVSDRGDALALIADVTGARVDEAAVVAAGAKARWLDPWVARNLGVGLLEGGALTRWGRWRRTQFFVPFARVQSVSVRQGPVQRWLGLATVYLDMPSGVQRWQAQHRETADAAALVGELAVQARLHRAPARVGTAPYPHPASPHHDPT